MSLEGRLALPGEGLGRVSLRPSRAVLGAGVAVAWLLLRSSLLPSLGLAAMPLDPVIPLLVAYCLSAGRIEALGMALALGLVADSLVGVGSVRFLLQYLLVVLLASPSAGRIVLRDRWMPSVGVALVTVASGLLVYLLLSLLGAELPMDVRALPSEAFNASVASVLLWPFFLRLSGSKAAGTVSVGRRL